MIYRRITLLIITLFAIGSISYFRAGNDASEAAALPVRTIDLADARPAFGLKTTGELIEFWRGRFDRDPRDFISLTYLAGAYISQGRETGDIAAYQKAEVALREALTLNDNYETALAYLATVRLMQHEFRDALDLAQRVYAFDPGALQALATIGDAQLELGNYAEAEAAYRQLAAQRPSPPVYSRLARLAWLQNRPEEAINEMQRAVSQAEALGLTPQSLAWYQFQLGELYFNTGQIEQAEQYYITLLEIFPNYYLGLVGLGKVRAAQGDFESAIAHYEQATAAIPQPDFLASLGNLYLLTGQPHKTQIQYDTVEYIGRLSELNQQIYNRQLAYFYADHDLHLDKALALATAELEVRRDIYGFDAAAWAYYKNGQLDQAQKMIEQAMQLGTPDASLYYHAGMIAQARENTSEAERLLTRSLTINPYFDPLQASIAQATLEQIRKN